MDDIIEYDDKHRCTHRKFDYGYEVWYKYDDNDNIIYRKDSDNKERWFNNKGHITHIKNPTGYEAYYKYDEYCKIIDVIEYYNK